MITKEDIAIVANNIDKQLTEKQIQEVLELYPSQQATEPLTNCSLIVEDCIYNVIK